MAKQGKLKSVSTNMPVMLVFFFSWKYFSENPSRAHGKQQHKYGEANRPARENSQPPTATLGTAAQNTSSQKINSKSTGKQGTEEPNSRPQRNVSAIKSSRETTAQVWGSQQACSGKQPTPNSNSRYSSPEHKLPENQQQKHGKAGNRGAKQQAPKVYFMKFDKTVRLALPGYHLIGGLGVGAEEEVTILLTLLLGNQNAIGSMNSLLLYSSLKPNFECIEVYNEMANHHV
ncbi:hypothetical protein M5K25_026386 [Dendrobium thyrsiflorum]|uniref:Uncharacterized protein n=1 Tax=Dendrobium thyrsiflorum TaxID=117978 RepID=A0ABD0TX78_DENTH